MPEKEKTIPPNISKLSAEKETDYLKRLQKLRIIDDTFMRAVFQNERKLTEFVLRILLHDPALQIRHAQTQADMIQPPGIRSVEMDIFAVDNRGRLFNIEAEKSRYGADPRRARYHAAVLDWGILRKQESFLNLPETFVILITEGDIYRKGKAVYVFDRQSGQAECMLRDGTHILYVNGQYRGDDELGWLMHDFFCVDPGEMHYRQLQEKVQFLKYSREGKRQMCRLMDELEERGRKEGRKEGRDESIMNAIRALGKTMNMTAKEAMNALRIPAEEQKRYLQKL